MLKLHYIIWNPDVYLIKIDKFYLLWYSILILFSFFAGIKIVKYIYIKYNKNSKEVDNLSFYIFFFTLAGARLGDVLFYNLDYYLINPLEVFLPIKFPELYFIGYKGLSYHGAIIGVILGIYVYNNFYLNINFSFYKFKFIKRKFKFKEFLWISTPIALGFLMGLFVRLGNFINSEIIGIPTKNTFGVLFINDVIGEIQNNFFNIKFINAIKINNILNGNKYQAILINIFLKNFNFKKNEIRDFVEFNIKKSLLKNQYIYFHINEKNNYPIFYKLLKLNRNKNYIVKIETLCIPRHPIQLYECASYFAVFIFIFIFYKKKIKIIKNGLISSIVVIFSYLLRFFLEFFKKPFNIIFNIGVILTMGHLLSLLTVIIGILLFIYLFFYMNNEKY